MVSKEGVAFFAKDGGKITVKKMQKQEDINQFLPMQKQELWI